MKKEILREKIFSIFVFSAILLMNSQLSFAALTGTAKYLGPVITFLNDFRLELIIVLTAAAALIIIWIIWENMTDQNMPNMWKRIAMVAIIYVVTLKVPDIIIALGGAQIDVEALKIIKQISGV